MKYPLGAVSSVKELELLIAKAKKEPIKIWVYPNGKGVEYGPCLRILNTNTNLNKGKGVEYENEKGRRHNVGLYHINLPYSSTKQGFIFTNYWYAAAWGLRMGKSIVPK